MKEVVFNDISDITACAWFNIIKFTLTKTILSLHGHSAGCNEFLIFFLEKNIKIAINDIDYYSPPIIFTPFQWNHICVSWSNQGTLRLYFNGSIFCTKSDVYKGKLDFQRVLVGQDVDIVDGQCKANDPTQAFLGQISMVNVWKRELNAEEVSKVHREEYGPGDIFRWEELLQFKETSLISKKTVYINESWWS